jgi:hypothetical protein
MALIDDVRLNLRITSSAYNTEIEDLILSAKLDLGLSGVTDEAIDTTDALVKRAIILYCKANFGYNNADADRFQQSYDMLKAHLTLSADYAYYSITFEVEDSLAVAIREAKVTVISYTDTEATAEQIKYTDENGQCTFYLRAGSNYKYTVSADGYKTDDDNLLDVSASTTVSITLIGA